MKTTSFLSVAPCEVVLDSLCFWIPRYLFRTIGSGFRIPGQWNLDSGFQSLAGFRIYSSLFLLYCTVITFGLFVSLVSCSLSLQLTLLFQDIKGFQRVDILGF